MLYFFFKEFFLDNTTTFEITCSFLPSFYLNRLISRLVAFQNGRWRAFVPNVTLLRFQHQNRTIDQVEEKLRILVDNVAVGEQMTTLLGRDIFAVVGTESNASIRLPRQIKEVVGRTARKKKRARRKKKTRYCRVRNAVL